MKIRHKPRYAIVTLMKARRVRGIDVAAKVGTSQSTFTRVIARDPRVAEDIREKVWAELERVLA
jgi:hypothetical protein